MSAQKYNRVREPEPSYTHALHEVACREAALKGQVLVQQLLVRKGAVVYCCTLKRPYIGVSGLACWTVEASWPERLRLTVSCANSIVCPSECCSCLGPESASESLDSEFLEVVTCQ